MRKLSKRVLYVGACLMLLLASLGGAWVSLTHQPRFYRAIVRVPHAQQEAKAKRFVSQSMQLVNDINNEPTWEAVFTDQEVNAWLAEDLVTHFADQLPPEVHEPRIVFDADRVTLAFQLDQGPVSSVIWVMARPRVAAPNVLELTLEKIRAGVLPMPSQLVLERITQHARQRGLDIQWRRDGSYPVAIVRYEPDSERDDVRLDALQIRAGQIRLAGKSNRPRGAARALKLPTRKVLQLKFPRRTIQGTAKGVSFAPAPVPRSSASPTSCPPSRRTRTCSGVQTSGS